MNPRMFLGWAMVVAVAALLFLSGCGGGGGPSGIDPGDGGLVLPAQSVKLLNATGGETNRLVTSPAVAVSPGGEFALPVSVSDASGVAGMVVRLAFDSSAFVCLGVTPGDRLAPGSQVVANPAGVAGVASLAAASATPSAAGSGTLATFRMKATTRAASPVASPRLSLALSDQQGKTVGCSEDMRPASIRTAATSDLIGDLLGSGNPDVGSAIKILRVVVHLDASPLASDLWQWDCNGSGYVDVGDAIKLLRCVVGLDLWPIGTNGDPYLTPPPPPPI